MTPNLLLIVTDQQARSTLAAYGNERIRMPRLNALAERSTVFHRAYCAQPVCGPARAALFTGTWPHHNGQITLDGRPTRDRVPCLTDLLDDRWVCGFFGRSGHHRYADGPAPRAAGVDELDFDDGAPAEVLRAHGLTPLDGVRFGKRDRPFIPEHLGGPANIAAKACDFIRRHRRRPFALTLCFYEPHDPLSGPLNDLHPFDQVPLPDNWGSPPAPDQPRKALLEHRCVLHRGKDGIALRSEQAWRLLIQRYWGLCAQVDRALGRVFDQLDAAGVSDDTLIVFTADHGEMAGSHQLFGKNLMFEESIGVPLLISRPEQRAARRVRAPVSHVDVAPTVLEELGAAAPDHLQGASLTPWLGGGGGPERPAFVEWTGVNYLVHDDLQRDPLPGYLARITTREAGLADLADTVRAVIAPDGWKFCLSAAGQHELYDLDADPGETVNLAFRVEHAERRRLLTPHRPHPRLAARHRRHYAAGMSTSPVRFAQFGVGHSHAAGKAQVMADNPGVELIGVWEPDADRRAAAGQQAAYGGARWLDDADEALSDPAVAAVAVEGDVFQSVPWAQRAVDAGKHVWLDKPAGLDMEAFRRVVETARERNLLVQLGYMFRYNRGARFLLDWALSGRLGEIHAVQGHISLTGSQSARGMLAQLPGGPAFEILCHVIDLVVALLGRPQHVTGILRDHAAPMAGAVNNTAVILEYPRALALLQSTAFEVDHGARRLEVHGTRGSVALAPIEPPAVRLNLDADRDGFRKGPQQVPVAHEPRYVASLQAIVEVIRGQRAPDRSLDHELAVQETILRAVHMLPKG